MPLTLIAVVYLVHHFLNLMISSTIKIVSSQKKTQLKGIIILDYDGGVMSMFMLYLFTAGEDGQVKIWSRSGMLRNTLSQNSESSYVSNVKNTV